MTDDSPTDFETAKTLWHEAVRYAESVKHGKAEVFAQARAEAERLAGEAVKLIGEGKYPHIALYRP